MTVSRETPQLQALVDFLTGPGIERGLLGPREAERIWERHIFNCSVVAEAGVAESGEVTTAALIPARATVVDVGSGAGLPGVVWALVRPDITVTLVESLQRRTTFLSELVDTLELAERVTVIRSRAEDVVGVQFDVSTARAVAPLSRLLPWLGPLTTDRVLALKGRSAADEVQAAAGVARRLGFDAGEVLTIGKAVVDPPTTVVRYTRTTS